MPHILQNHYVLAVHDLATSSGFFVSLGFKVISGPEGWVFVEKDNCLIMLGECPDALDAKQLGDHSYFGYLRVDDADAYHQELTARGFTIQPSIATTPWGMREFGVESPEGHRLMIGQRIGEK